MKHLSLKALALGLALGVAPALAATPDALITAKAKLALWTSELRTTGVRVDTNDGVVTLLGKVTSPERKTLAEQKVRALDGVRAVKNMLEVVPAAEVKRVDAADKDIEKDAKQALSEDPALKKSKLSVRSVANGVVTLGGEARTFDEQLRAIALIDRVPGVRRVNSELSSPPMLGEDDRLTFSGPQEPARSQPGEPRTGELGQFMSDTRITGAVKMRLFTATQIPSTEINVDTMNGVVTLFGMVPTDQVKRAAEAEAARVSGVAKVENQLQVVPSDEQEVVQARDADITKDLKLAFKDKPQFKGINTAVRNGVVQLSGKVGSNWEELDAVRTARMVKGVRGVTNLIKVEDQGPPPRKEDIGS